MPLRNNAQNPSESDMSEEPSEQLIALLLEIDRAFRDQRPPKLDEGMLKNLIPKERRRLQSAQQRLQILYDEAQATQLGQAGRCAIPLTVKDLSNDSSDSERPDLATFYQMAGSRFGTFEILRGLGMGGHGVVFLARDPTLDRLVALKVPRPDVLIQPSMRKRFLAEGRAAALLLHPNIVTVFESGEIGAVCYLAQDYVAGPSLAAWLKDHPQPVAPRVAAGMILQLVDAVDLAHRRQILHRDIKPGNILLAPLSSIDQAETLDQYLPKLADFGMAKLLQGQAETRTAAILGTPAYMSPEQAAGNQRLMGPTSDLYSLGAVLFEVLTHKPLYQGGNELETLHQILHTDPPTPRTSVPGVPHDLEAICMKCLRREPQERYRTARELADDLRRYLDGRPVLARPQSVWSTLYHWSHRNPATAALSSSAILATFALVVGLAWFNTRLNQSLRTVQQHKSDLETQTKALRRRVYADDLNLASKAWANSDVDQVKKRLEPYIPRGDDQDFRTFPWWILWRQSQESSLIFGHHAGGATAIAIDRTGTLGASAGIDGIIQLWKLPEGQPAGRLHGHEAKDINSLHFSPGGTGRKLVSASDDGTVQVWNTESQTQEHILKGHDGWVAVARFLGPHGEMLATAGHDQIIRIWDATTGELTRKLTGHTDVVRDLCDRTDDHLLASTSEDGTIRLWNWATGMPDARLPDGKLETPGKTWARIIDLSPDKSVLAAGFRNGELIEWDLHADRFGQIRQKSQLATSIRTLEWRDDDSLLIGTETNILFGRAMNQGGYSWESLRGHSEKVMAVQSSGAEGGCLSADQGGDVRWWPQNTLDGDLKVVPPLKNYAPLLQWNGSLIATSVQPTEISGYRLPDLKLAFQVQIANRSNTTWFCPFSDGQALMFHEESPDDDYFTCYETHGKTHRWRLPLEHLRLHSSQMSPDERAVALCLESEVWIVDTQTGQKEQRLRHPTGVRMAQFSDDRSILFTVSADGKLRVWHMTTGELMSTHLVHRDAATHLSLSFDGTRLATCGEDRKARVWRLSDWTEITSFSLPDLPLGLSLLDEGITLATVCGTKLIFWSVPDQVQLMEWDDIGREHTHLQFSPDRKSVAVQREWQIRLYRGAP